MSDTLATAKKAASALLKARRARATELPPRSQLFTLRVTPHVDPIFTPRDYPYSDKEVAYIRALAPLGHLPLSLLPTDENPYPPLMQYGWTISDALKAQLFRCADAEGTNYVARYGATHNSETLTLEIALGHLIKESDISWSNRQYVRLVATKADRRPTQLFTLYSNHELFDVPNGNLPSKEDVEKVCALFQLTEAPSWYPTMLDLEWGDGPMY